MDMECYGVRHGDWSSCRRLTSFPMTSQSQLLVSEHGLPADAHYGDHHGLLGDSSSSLIIRDDETPGDLPMIHAPIAVDDSSYRLDRLPPLPADAVTAGLDDALLNLPFSDIDLDAFCDAGDQKNAVNHLDMAILPAVDHRFGAQHRYPPLPMQIIDHQHHSSAGGGVGVVIGHGYHPGVGGDSIVVTGYQALAATYGAEQQKDVKPEAAARARSNVQVQAAAPAPGGRTRLDHIGFEELKKYFYMPITMAAREMNVGLTVLKKRCRELGVARWPHRKMKSLKSLILSVQEMGKGGMSTAAMQREVMALETYCAMMEENPAMGLTPRTKKLRQATFKETYKRRKAAAMNSMLELDHCYGYAHQQLPLAPVISRRSQGSSFFASSVFTNQ